METSAARLSPSHAVFPSRQEFRRLAQTATLIPVYTEVIADTETPVSALLKLGDSPYRYILESVERGERLGRYWFVGNTASLVFKSRGKRVSVGRPPEGDAARQFEFEHFEVVRSPRCVARPLKRVPPRGRPRPSQVLRGAVGYLSYDMVRATSKSFPTSTRSTRPSRSLLHL